MGRGILIKALSTANLSNFYLMFFSKLTESEVVINSQRVEMVFVRPKIIEEVILILHGWNELGYKSWIPVLKDIAATRKRALILTPSMPGFGQSEEPKTIWKVEDYVDWVVDFLLSNGDLFGQKLLSDKVNKSVIRSQFNLPLTILGHSFGGVVATGLSLKLAKNTASLPFENQKLVLLAPAIIRSEPNLKTKIKIYLARTLKKLLEHKPLSYLKPFLYRLLGAKDYGSKSEKMKLIMRKIITQDKQGWARQLTTPTVLLWGKQDKITPYFQALELNKIITGSRLVSLEGINHGIHLHSPKAILEVI